MAEAPVPHIVAALRTLAHSMPQPGDAGRTRVHMLRAVQLIEEMRHLLLEWEAVGWKVGGEPSPHSLLGRTTHLLRETLKSQERKA